MTHTHTCTLPSRDPCFYFLQKSCPIIISAPCGTHCCLVVVHSPWRRRPVPPPLRDTCSPRHTTHSHFSTIHYTQLHTHLTTINNIACCATGPSAGGSLRLSLFTPMYPSTSWSLLATQIIRCCVVPSLWLTPTWGHHRTTAIHINSPLQCNLITRHCCHRIAQILWERPGSGGEGCWWMRPFTSAATHNCSSHAVACRLGHSGATRARTLHGGRRRIPACLLDFSCRAGLATHINRFFGSCNATRNRYIAQIKLQKLIVLVYDTTRTSSHLRNLAVCCSRSQTSRPLPVPLVTASRASRRHPRLTATRRARPCQACCRCTSRAPLPLRRQQRAARRAPRARRSTARATARTTPRRCRSSSAR